MTLLDAEAQARLGSAAERAFGLPDGELGYLEAGQGPPLLLIHGSGPDSASWRETLPDLARDNRVIAPDRRGYRLSRALPVHGGWHQHAEDMAALIGGLEIAPVPVVGLSGGGIAALDLAVNHPRLVSSIVLIECPVFGKRQLTPGLARTFLRAQLERRLRGPRRAFEPYVRWITGARSGGSTWDELPAERREATLDNADAAWADIDSGDGSHLGRESVKALSMPVTVIYASESQPWFEKCARALAELIPQAELRVLEGATHAVTFRHPHEVAELIRAGVRA